MKQSAFSLVELSIVLVILGLLTGGILGGQTLMRAAELRSVTEDIGKYTTALYTFRDKYFALPGDMPNATQFWGTGATCPTDRAGGTCNGDGNGSILGSPYTSSEKTYVAQHLALAGLIEGQYNLNWPAADPLPHNSGYAYPLKLDQLSLLFSYHGGAAATHYDNFGGHNYLWLSTMATVGFHTGYMDPAVKCVEAWQLDKKMDDGKPGTGKMMNMRTRCNTDSVGANYATADYLLESSGTTTIIAIQFD